MLCFSLLACSGTKERASAVDSSSTDNKMVNSSSKSSNKASKLSKEEQMVQDALNERLIKKLGLSEDQVAPFNAIANDFSSKSSKVRDGKGTQEEKFSKIEALKVVAEAELAKFLNAGQMTAFKKHGFGF